MTLMSNYYKQPLKDTDYFISNFKDQKTKDVFLSFLNNVFYKYTDEGRMHDQYKIKAVFDLFCDSKIYDLTWNDLIDKINSLEKPRDGYRILKWILEQNILQKDNFDDIARYALPKVIKEETYHLLLSKKITPDNLIFIPREYLRITGCYFIHKLDYNSKKAIKEELFSTHLTSKGALRDFCKEISSYLQNHAIHGLDQDDIVEYFSSVSKYNGNNKRGADFLSISKEFFIRYISNLSYDEQEKRFSLYKTSLLRKAKFIPEFYDGFMPVLYNRNDPIPVSDKLWIIANGEERSSTQLSKDSVISIDFTRIKNGKMRFFAKKYLWYYSSNIATKTKELQSIIRFSNMYISEGISEKLYFDERIAASYKSFVLNKYQKTETRNGAIYPISNFLKFIDDEPDVDIDKNVFIYLRNRGALKIGGAGDITDEDCTAIGKYFDQHKYDSHRATMFYVIFNIALSTPFRSSQIIHMKVNAIHEGMKKGQYIIALATKVTHGEIEEYPCPSVLKRIIDSYLVYTNDFREGCTDPNLKEYLFLTKSYAGAYRTINIASFNGYLKKACDKCGIKNTYTFKNLRSTNLTKTKEFVLRNGLSDAATIAITDHRNVDTLNNHYIKEYITDALQASNNVIIGNVDIKGNIIQNASTINTSKEVTVQNGCGFCQSDFCSEYGPLPCLMCRNFATTVDRIPYYESQIKLLDQAIEKSLYREDIEAYVNIKRLYLVYYRALLSLKEDQNASNTSIQ